MRLLAAVGVLLLVTAACRERRPARGAVTAPASVRSGSSVSVTALWPGRSGEVTFTATRGQLRPDRAQLDQAGAATTRFQCFATDAGPCVGDLRIDARLEGDVASASLVAIAEDDGAHLDGNDGPVLEFQVRVQRADAGEGRRSSGGFGTEATWWHWDGGVYQVQPDEVVDYDCGWDGGAHPGYTLPNGVPSATGCDDEPIDVVLWEDSSEDAVDFCGTVTFTRPLTEPVYPRAAYQFSGPYVMRSKSTACCARFFCLRDPSRLRYRLRLSRTWRSSFSVGARTRNFGASLFSKAPFGLDATAFPPGAFARLPTFEVGDGYREGDQPPGGR